MFARKAGAKLSGASFWCSTQGQPPSFTHKHLAWLEKLDSDKHSSLLCRFVNYGRKFFITLGPDVVCVSRHLL
jgi:hypothetical protein